MEHRFTTWLSASARPHLPFILSLTLTLILCLTVTVPAIATDNLTGRVVCGGKGVARVKVSDGKVITVTDRDGYYSFASDKMNGYVFYTLPSGYEPATADGFRPLFWARLNNSDTAVVEKHNFVLHKRDNSHFRFVVGTDSHLNNNTKLEDLKQYDSYYIPALRDVAAQAKADDVPVYSVILGDLTWDVYWYKRKFALPNFLRTNTAYGYPMILWPVMGNHDNDPAAVGDSVDYLASAPWRRIMGPTYYSFNLGGVHFLVLDDIVYKNTPFATVDPGDSVAGKRDYDAYITEEQLKWVARDLSFIADSTTPVIVCCHIPTMHLRGEAGGFASYESLARQSSYRLHTLLARFTNVHILSGHVHNNFVAHCPSHPNITEHNQSGICNSWWNPGHYAHQETGVYRQVSRDGSPGGYALWDIDGRKLSWRYVSTDPVSRGQMRIYDMNTVKDFYASDSVMRKLITAYPTIKDYSDFEDNMIMVNVFAYDTDWKVEIFEDGEPLTPVRITGEDPLYNLCYSRPRYAETGCKSVSKGFLATKVSHLFVARASSADRPVTVRVTDHFGNVYTSAIRRPLPYDMLTGREQTDTEVTGISAPLAGDDNISVSTTDGGLEITTPRACRITITSTDGTARRLRLRAGSNSVSLSRGVYIITAKKTSVKVVL